MFRFSSGQRASMSIENILKVAARLGDLLQEVVFLGGACTPLLITDIAAQDVRPTQDVDFIFDAKTQLDVWDKEAQLRALGFQHSINGPICRWLIDDLEIDAMPADENLSGMKSAWFPLALANAHRVDVGAGLVIRVISAPLFVCTKFEAFTDYLAGFLDPNLPEREEIILYRLRQIADL